jgi:sporulation protein YlmC with PRC-barrel domain
MHTTDTATVRVLSASTLGGDKVVDTAGEKLGKLEDLMIDLDRGTIAYAVLSVGGVLGMGDKLFAIPFGALKLNDAKDHFTLNVPKERLKEAPGFDKDDWPSAADRTWGREIHTFYGVEPYWGV